jgi:rare lipoprotein A
MTIRFVIIILTFILAGCTSTKQQISYNNLSKDDKDNILYKGHYKIGDPYTINNKTYSPVETKDYKATGIASWYGKKYGFHGRKTANGDVYNANLLTAAHQTLPMPSLVKVTNLSNNKSIIVMVNDRGPFAKNRIIDVSEKVADFLDFKNKGTTNVKIEYLHSDTKKFLKRVGLKREKHNKVTIVPNPKCTINCHIKMINLEHKININHK